MTVAAGLRLDPCADAFFRNLVQIGVLVLGKGGRAFGQLGGGEGFSDPGLGFVGFPLAGRVLRVGFRRAQVQRAKGIAAPARGRGDKVLDGLGRRKVRAHSGFFVALRFEIRDGFERGFRRLRLHDRVRLINALLEIFFRPVDEDENGRDQDRKTEPDGPVIFLFPQIRPGCLSVVGNNAALFSHTASSSSG